MAEKLPDVYRSKDGLEWPNLEEAQKHESVVVAMEAYEKAAQEMAMALASTLKTADGYPFDPSNHAHHYWVRGIYVEDAAVQEVRNGYGNLSLSHDHGSVVVSWDMHNARDPFRLRPEELYRDRANAEAELVKRLKNARGFIDARIEDLGGNDG